MHLSRNCPFSNKTNLHLELPGFCAPLPLSRTCVRLRSFAPICALMLGTFRGATGSPWDPPTRTYPSGTDPAEPLRPDLIWTRSRPDLDLESCRRGRSGWQGPCSSSGKSLSYALICMFLRPTASRMTAFGNSRRTLK